MSPAACEEHMLAWIFSKGA